MIAIIDYDAGNLKSVEKAFQFLKQEVTVTRDFHDILYADKVVLPGVGSFGDAMEKLHKFDLVNIIQETIRSGTPFLGICMGLQLLFESSEEAKGVAGLSVLKGKVLRIPSGNGLKIPHMGWNSLTVRPGAKLFQGIEKNPYVYFVHSYYLQAEDEETVAASTEYGVQIHASVEHANIYACQFHPEKSGGTGLKILSNFAAL